MGIQPSTTEKRLCKALKTVIEVKEPAFIKYLVFVKNYGHLFDSHNETLDVDELAENLLKIYFSSGLKNIYKNPQNRRISGCLI